VSRRFDRVDAVLVAGFVCVVIGLAAWSWVVALVVVGFVLIGLGCLAHYARSRRV